MVVDSLDLDLLRYFIKKLDRFDTSILLDESVDYFYLIVALIRISDLSLSAAEILQSRDPKSVYINPIKDYLKNE